MGSFGDRLKRERELRGITLEEICESTKISRRHLQALEEETFDQLPGGVFNKGFVRAYARFLGTDEEQAVSDYVAASGDVPPPEDQFPLEIHEEPESKKKKKSGGKLLQWPFVLAAAALIGALTGYIFWEKSKSHAEASAPSAAVDLKQEARSTPPTIASTAQPTVRGVPESPAKATAHNPGPAEKPLVPREVAVSNNAPLQESTTDSMLHSFQLVVRAKEDSWVSITVDGKRLMQGVLGADKRRMVRGGKQVVLRTGNAGGLEISYNGRHLGVLGSENETRTLTFTSAGLVQ